MRMDEFTGGLRMRVPSQSRISSEREQLEYDKGAFDMQRRMTLMIDQEKKAIQDDQQMRAMALLAMQLNALNPAQGGMPPQGMPPMPPQGMPPDIMQGGGLDMTGLLAGTAPGMQGGMPPMPPQGIPPMPPQGIPPGM